MINPLTFKQVMKILYCKKTKVVISADYHGTVVITSEIQCKLKEVRVGVKWSFFFSFCNVIRDCCM